MVKKNNLTSLLYFIFICLLAGVIGSYFTMPAIPVWYTTLKKSVLNPPNYVFGPVWTTLYIMMGVAAWQINISKKNKQSRPALIFFYIQLGLNLLWSFLFFDQKQLLLSFIEIIILWLFIFSTTIKFYKIKKSAGLIMVPYLLWVSFATYLTYSAWWLNK